MRYFRHLGDGQVCWTFPDDTSALHWRTPRAGERSGTVHCGRRHDNPVFLDELTEADARALLSPASGRSALIERTRSVLSEHTPLTSADVTHDGAPVVSPLALAVQVADALILDGYRRP